MHVLGDDALLLPPQPLTRLADYLAAGGGQALARATANGPDAVFAEIRESGLRGRGGAGFPTARKWEAVRNTPYPAPHLVCNAAEGEPGTFKDRWLLRTNPFQVLEGLAIAALALGAKAAVIALKQGFTREVRLVRHAVAEMQAAGMFGSTPVHVATGPDEYLFGEEKALLEVIEGNDPLPRILPPHRVGLFARRSMTNPTLVHNAETLANVPVIVRDGAASFRSIGSRHCPGTKLFTVCGDVAEPGVYELPMGTPLDTLLARAGGPIDGGAQILAVFVGASAPPIPRSRFSTALDYDSMPAAGLALGSAGFVAYDESVCPLTVALQLTRFLWVESCAQCPACKQGARDIVDALARIENGHGSDAEIKVLHAKSASVTGGSRCGLPAGTASLTNGLLEFFHDEVRAHLEQGCPSRRPVVLPKIVDYEPATHTFAYDPTYHAKQPDWTYTTTAPGGPGTRRSCGDEPTGGDFR